MPKQKLYGTLEGLEDSLQREENKLDTVRLDIPLFIRLLEYAREDAKTDMDLHVVTERLTALCLNGRLATMEDYDELVKKTATEPAAEGMRNDTESQVVVHMKNIDQANALAEALEKFGKIASQGGDAEMVINSADEPVSCGVVGHDVRFVDVKHVIPEKESE